MSSDGGAAVAFLVVFILGIGALAFWIWAIVDVVRVPDDSMFRAASKLVWVLVIVFAGVIGAIIYLAVGRPAGGRPPASGSQMGWGPPLPPPPPPGTVG